MSRPVLNVSACVRRLLLRELSPYWAIYVTVYCLLASVREQRNETEPVVDPFEPPMGRDVMVAVTCLTTMESVSL